MRGSSPSTFQRATLSRQDQIPIRAESVSTNRPMWLAFSAKSFITDHVPTKTPPVAFTIAIYIGSLVVTIP